MIGRHVFGTIGKCRGPRRPRCEEQRGLVKQDVHTEEGDFDDDNDDEDDDDDTKDVYKVEEQVEESNLSIDFIFIKPPGYQFKLG